MGAFLRAGRDAVPVDVNGHPDIIALPNVQGSDAIPVWDKKETLLFGGSNQPPVLCSRFGDLLAADVAAHPFDATAKRGWPPALRKSIKSELPAGQQRSALPDTWKRSHFLTPLLAGNDVIFFSGGTGNWHVVAVGRTDPALLWDVRIPAQPMFGGLSMTCAGDVLAPLVDGRVVCIGAPRDFDQASRTSGRDKGHGHHQQ